jgi:hypothetical protein
VGDTLVLGDNEVEAWHTYQQWRRDDPSREVALMYNHRLKKWAVVQGEAARVSTGRASDALGWDRGDVSLLSRHTHPPDTGGVTAEANLNPSGRKADLDTYRKDAAKGDTTAGGEHMAAIDVTTAHGPDVVYVFYDRKTNVFTVRSPNPAAGPRQYVWRSFPGITYYHFWFRNEFGSEPSDVKLFGPTGSGGAAPTRPDGPSGGTTPMSSKGDIIDQSGTVVASSDASHYSVVENFGDKSAHGLEQARYYVRAELDGGGVMSADFMLRRDDVPGQPQGEWHRSTLRGADEFKKAIAHFESAHPGAVKEIKADWGLGDNLDTFNKTYIDALQKGLSHDTAVQRAAESTTTAGWARDAGFTSAHVQTANRDQAGVFTEVVARFRK